MVSLLIAGLVVASSDAAAQAPCNCGPSGPNAATLGLEKLALGGDVTPTILTFRYTDLPATGAGFELGILVAAARDYAFFAFELGPSMTLPGDWALPHIRAGMNLLMGVFPGVYFGGGVTIPAGQRVGLRFDVTHRIWLVGEGGTVGMWSAGLGLSWRSRPSSR